MRIIVVDDSPTMRDIAASTLRSEGFDVLTAEHGEHALKVLETEAVDLVVSDLNMYQMGGFEFVVRLRENPDYEFTPVIFLTTENSEDFKEMGREVGASAWMVKPFEPAALVKLIRRLTQTDVEATPA